MGENVNSTCIVPGCERKGICVGPGGVANQLCVLHWEERYKSCPPGHGDDIGCDCEDTSRLGDPSQQQQLPRPARIPAVLARFVRQACANYVSQENVCVRHENACNVLCGKPCQYFASSVLGPPDYPYPIPGFDYDKIHAAYRRIAPGMAVNGKAVRLCACGKPLPKRRRCCDDCRLKRRRTRQKAYQFARRRKAG